MKKLVRILTVYCCIANSSAQAIECLSAPNHSDRGGWSWRDIEGRKCWYKKVGAVPPKSEFRWPEQAKETLLTESEAPAQQELPSIQATEANAATSPQVEVLRVKPADPTTADFRLSGDRVRLIEASYLSGLHGIGGAWEVSDYTELPADTFEARYGQW